MTLDTACIFVDGENLRHSLVDLFKPDFNPTEYLPRNADWVGFFNELVRQTGAARRLRTYWYVVDEIDFWPWGISRLLREPRKLEAVLRKYRPYVQQLDQAVDQAQKDARIDALARALMVRERQMKNRFEGWQTFQKGICHRFDAIEFRRAGSISYNLFRETLEREKAVDVHLATDLLELRNIYDVGIIVSGDQDYVPAVQAVKDSGKHIVNVSFLKRDGMVLPGGARRLNQNTDSTIEMEYNDVKKFMGFPSLMAAAGSRS
jgi:uncharacterized LabA/DUF88 family protein